MKPVARSVLGPSLVLAILAQFAGAQDVGTTGLDPTATDGALTSDPAPSQQPKIIFTVPDENPPPPEPVVLPEPPDYQVMSSVENVLQGEGRSIIVHRVSPLDLAIPEPPPPPPVVDTESPEFQALLAAARAKYETRMFVPLSVTVYDHKVSHIRWTWRDPSVPCATTRSPRMRVVPPDGQAQSPPAGVVFYEAWSNIDWEVMRGVLAVEAGGIRHEMMPGIGCVGVDTASRFGRTFEMPDHPELPESPATFVVTMGDPSNMEATACLRAIHAAYPAQAEELWAAHAIRERLRLEHEAWLKANPPQPQDTIIHCWKATKEQAAQIRKLVP